MKKALTAVCALALLASAAAGCTDSNQSGGKVGERPGREAPPSASPPTGASPSTPTTPPPTR